MTLVVWHKVLLPDHLGHAVYTSISGVKFSWATLYRRGKEEPARNILREGGEECGSGGREIGKAEVWREGGSGDVGHL